MTLARIQRTLAREGLLLVTDPVLPSVAGIVAGEPIKGSWWSHPASHAIFATLEALEDGESTLLVKLASKKLTFVHDDLWSDFFAVATAKAPWQLTGLSRDDRRLLNQVETEGEVRLGKSSTQLELRLLAHGKSIHTESGAHAKVLRSWTASAESLGVRIGSRDPESAKGSFESCLERWKAEYGKSATLPWTTA